MMTKTGEYLWFNVRGKVLQDLNGKNIRFAGSMIDITGKKKYETKLQESYQELEAAYEELTAVQEELMLGSVSPLKFITVVKNTHLIIPLGAWVLKNACAFIKKLHNKGYINLTLSVNVSILQLLQTDFNDLVTDTLEFYEIKPEYLELEVTESILMESFETIGKKLEILKEIGIKIALNDFGMI